MKYFIKTFGCQMNQDDSAEMARMLRGFGMEETDESAEADLVHVNTCSVRKLAEEKFYSFLGRLRIAKSERPLVIGVSGCVSENEDLESRFPFLDYAIGSGRPMDYMPRIADVLHAKFPNLGEYQAGAETAAVFSFQTVIRGCANYCSYCVVPRARGAERSIPPEETYEAARARVEAGAKEITLLGQNVLAYGLDLEPKRGLLEVLEKLHDLPGLLRLRFVTSHPSWVEEDFLRGMARLPKVCEYFHIPFQSGDDEILRRMNRRYTSDEYLRALDLIRKYFPAAGISADAIVGFPGETEEHFKNTLKLVRRARVDNIYAFKYSPRPGTAAADEPDDVKLDEKKRRLAELNALHNSISREINSALIGTEQEIMIEDVQPSAGRIRGRTRTGKVADIKTDKHHLQGDLAIALINKATPHGIQGVERE